MNGEKCQVAVIGGGPSGLSIATELKHLGVDKVLVLERENTGGGVPRHCGHSPFGMREFHRILNGTEYTHRLLERAEKAGVDIRLNTTVTSLGQLGELILSTNEGRQILLADKVVICTGAREKPRAARLVSGARPLGVTTTGALQSMVYLKQQRPFRRPVIIGSEMVAFSALLSCRHAGIKPVAMIEAERSIHCWQVSALLPWLLGTDLLTNTTLEEICGQGQVTSVKVKRPSGLETIECDGVIFSGLFVGETSLLEMAGLEIDNHGNFFVCGNISAPLKTAGQCWQQGRLVAKQVKAGL